MRCETHLAGMKQSRESVAVFVTGSMETPTLKEWAKGDWGKGLDNLAGKLEFGALKSSRRTKFDE